MAIPSNGEAVTDGGPSGLAARVTARMAADDAAGALAAAGTYLSLHPDDAQALQFCAIAERRLQRHARSFALLGRSLRTATDDGAVRRIHDDIVKATLAQLLRMADGEPLLAKALCDLLPLAGLNDTDTAILEQVRAHVLRVLLHQAVGHHQAGRWEEAAARYLAVLEIDPRHADALHLLGRIDRQQGRPLSALERIATALEIGGLPPEAEHSLQACLNDLFQELQHSYDARDFRGLLHSASRIQASCGRHLPAPYRDFMGALLHNASFPLYPELGDHELALACSEAAFTLTPNPQIYNQLRLLRLGTRDYARAWNPKDWALVHAGLPEVWDGSPCGSLLVTNSNGLGDFLQFLRFLPEAVRRVERVFLRVRPDLLPLVRHSPLLRGVTLVPPGAAVETERECELFGLPNILGLDPLRVPLPAPSFPLPADLVADWRRVVRRSDRPHIGLVWAVDAQNPRSVGLAPLLPVIAGNGAGNGAGSGAVFVALQNNEAKTELLGRSLPNTLQDFGIQGLPNLAAIMMACDLVVSVDCGLAHLACTLGLECWVMVQRHCDWRWHLEGDRCDWYPRARVFRQADQGDWTGAIGALGDALRLRFPTPAPVPAPAGMP